MPSKVFCDTSVILKPTFYTKNYLKITTCIVCIEEIDGLKSSETKGYLARDATKKLKNATNVDIKKEYDFSFKNRFLSHNNDNWILGFAYQTWIEDNEFVFLTDDFNLWLKAKAVGIPCDLFEFKEEKFDYKGYKEIILNDSELALFYSKKKNDFGLFTNEYLLIKNNIGEIVDKYRWNGKEFCPIIIDSKKNKLDFTYTEKIKPRNTQQELAFDLFQNKNITCKVIFGKHGSGKDLVMATHALSMIKQGVYDKLIFVRNNYEVANSNKIGYLPGDNDSKLLPFAMPLADHVGGIDGLTKLIDDGIVILQHLGFIRGRDIKRSLIYCSEAENMTKEHIQLLISRLSEGSALWLNGDFKQVDDNIFKRNSGLKQVINKLKGNELFGCVELNITERSKTAQLADLLD